MLACAGLSDEAVLPHALSEQRLAEHVVDLVRTGVVEVFAFEEDPYAARVFCESWCFGQKRWTVGIVGQQVLELGDELRVILGRVEGFSQLIERTYQGLRHPSAAVFTEVRAGRVTQGAGHERIRHGGAVLFRLWCAGHAFP